jgi:hypothetical protein
MSDQFSKAAVSVGEMAEMVGLSRQRFYDLIGPTFPYPIYSVATKRPFYDERLQELCLSVRRHNCGVDGKPVLFYSSRSRSPRRTNGVPRTKSPSKPVVVEAHPEILAAVRSLGLASVTDEQVAAAVQTVFPGGIIGVDQGQAIRSVFVHLRRAATAAR